MRKAANPKPRWATRFVAGAQKSKKVRKGPQTHLGIKSKEPDLMTSEEVFEANPLIKGGAPITINVPQAAPVAPVVQNQNVRTQGRGS